MSESLSQLQAIYWSMRHGIPLLTVFSRGERITLHKPAYVEQGAVQRKVIDDLAQTSEPPLACGIYELNAADPNLFSELPLPRSYSDSLQR
jgi:hypothetical protein